MVRTPGEIFSFMQSNKIGEKVSLFWIAWAFITEKAENFTLTDQIFQKGLSSLFASCTSTVTVTANNLVPARS